MSLSNRCSPTFISTEDQRAVWQPSQPLYPRFSACGEHLGQLLYFQCLCDLCQCIVLRMLHCPEDAAPHIVMYPWCRDALALHNTPRCSIAGVPATLEEFADVPPQSFVRAPTLDLKCQRCVTSCHCPNVNTVTRYEPVLTSLRCPQGNNVVARHPTPQEREAREPAAV